MALNGRTFGGEEERKKLPIAQISSDFWANQGWSFGAAVKVWFAIRKHQLFWSLESFFFYRAILITRVFFGNDTQFSLMFGFNHIEIDKKKSSSISLSVFPPCSKQQAKHCANFRQQTWFSPRLNFFPFRQTFSSSRLIVFVLSPEKNWPTQKRWGAKSESQEIRIKYNKNKLKSRHFLPWLREGKKTTY